MALDIVFVVIAGIFLLIGLVGTVVPILPGVPLAWCGLLFAHFSIFCTVPILWLIITGIIAAVVTVLDNLMPAAMTKRAGGSSWGVWGCTIGMIIGFFAGPIGIIVCPFFGALVGELIHDASDFNKSFLAALGAFKGFLTGIGVKMAAVGIFIWVFAWYLMKGLKG